MHEKIRCQQLQCQMDTNVRTLEQNRSECHALRLSLEELQRKQQSSQEHAAIEQQQKEQQQQQQQQQPAASLAQQLPTLELGREVLAIKDRLVELERQNAVLLAEKDNLNDQITTQKDQVLNKHAQLTVISQQLATLEV